MIHKYRHARNAYIDVLRATPGRGKTERQIFPLSTRWDPRWHFDIWISRADAFHLDSFGLTPAPSQVGLWKWLEVWWVFALAFRNRRTPRLNGFRPPSYACHPGMQRFSVAGSESVFGLFFLGGMARNVPLTSGRRARDLFARPLLVSRVEYGEACSCEKSRTQWWTVLRSAHMPSGPSSIRDLHEPHMPSHPRAHAC